MPKILLTIGLIALTAILLRWLYRNKPRFFPLFIAGAIVLTSAALYWIISGDRHYELLQDESLLQLDNLTVKQTSDTGFKIQLDASNQSTQNIAGFTLSLVIQECADTNDCKALTESSKSITTYIPSNESRKITQHFYLNKQEHVENISWQIHKSNIKIYK